MRLRKRSSPETSGMSAPTCVKVFASKVRRRQPLGLLGVADLVSRHSRARGHRRFCARFCRYCLRLLFRHCMSHGYNRRRSAGTGGRLLLLLLGRFCSTSLLRSDALYWRLCFLLSPTLPLTTPGEDD